jgi:hypothetical protein
MPTFSAAARAPHRLRIGPSDWWEIPPAAAIFGDQGWANESGHDWALRGRSPALLLWAFTRVRICASYGDVPPLGGGGGGGGGAGTGFGVALGVAVGVVEAGAGFGAGLTVVVRAGVAVVGAGGAAGAGWAAELVGAEDAGALSGGVVADVVVAPRLAAVLDGETLTPRATGSAGPPGSGAAPHAPRAATRTMAPATRKAIWGDRSDMSRETTPHIPRQRVRGRVHITPPNVVGCT